MAIIPGALPSCAFFDSGGVQDSACVVMARVDIPGRIMYVTGARYWVFGRETNFAGIRHDIALLYRRLKWKYFGVETNNYGRTEIESLHREYRVPVVAVNTVGRLNDPKASPHSLEKDDAVKLINSWRANAKADPDNIHKLGQVRMASPLTTGLRRLTGELDTFVRTTSLTGHPKYGAEGSHHDDGPMAMLGCAHLVRTRMYRYGRGAIGQVPAYTQRGMAITGSEIEKKMLEGRGLPD